MRDPKPDEKICGKKHHFPHLSQLDAVFKGIYLFIKISNYVIDS